MRGASLILGGSVVGLVAGFLLGGVRPRIEAATLRDELAASQAQLSKSRRGSGAGSRFLPIPGLSDLGQGSDGERSPERAKPENSNDGDRRSRRWWSPPPRDQKTELPQRSGAPPDANSPPSAGERQERFQAAIDIQKIRAQQSRAALKEKANLSDEHLARVDEVVLKMNKELAPYADQLRQLASADQEPQPLEMLFVSQEVSSILYKGQSEFEATVGPEPLEKVDPPTKQVWNYVDLEMFKGAAESLRARREANDAGAPFPPTPSSAASTPTP